MHDSRKRCTDSAAGDSIRASFGSRVGVVLALFVCALFGWMPASAMAANTGHNQPGAANSTVVLAAYCPDHPDVPANGTWVETRVVDGQHIDVYVVAVDRTRPEVVRVVCD
jgi:hypothetical protein